MRQHSAFATGSLLALAATLLLFGCASPRLEVQPYNGNSPEKGQSYVYYLPSTALHLRFTLVHKSYIPGPYAEFAEAYLGIPVESSTPKREYFLQAVSLRTSTVPDRSAPMQVFGDAHAQEAFLLLSSQGFLIPANAPVATHSTTGQRAARPTSLPYTDLSSKPFIDCVEQIFYTTVEQDSGIVRIPVQRMQNVERTLAEKARQAADQIFSLRNKRLELITGELETPNAPGAIEAMVKAIDRLEAAYLQLFTGRRVYDTVFRVVSITPSPEDASVIPCRFVETKGIVPASDIAGIPLVLTLSPRTKTDGEQELPPLREAYYYRAAEEVQIELSLQQEVLLQTSCPMLQYGPTLTLPTHASVVGRE